MLQRLHDEPLAKAKEVTFMIETLLIVHPDLMDAFRAANIDLLGVRVKESDLATTPVYESIDRFTEYEERDLSWAVPAGLVREVRRDPCIMILRHAFLNAPLTQLKWAEPPGPMIRCSPDTNGVIQ